MSERDAFYDELHGAYHQWIEDFSDHVTESG